jgi:hypothetical protein
LLQLNGYAKTETIMTAVALKSKLTLVLEKELESIDLYLSPYGMSRIEKIIDQGVERMGLDGVTDSIEKIYVAEKNLTHFLEYFCNYAKTLGSYPFLDDNAFDSALADCYPLWPFI